MLRVSDIFPQAASGSLADVVGSCLGSRCAASGPLVWLCCGRDAWPALSSWIPFPSDSPWVLWSFILCKSLVQSLDELSKGKIGPFFIVVSNDQWNCCFRYSGKPKPEPKLFQSLWVFGFHFCSCFHSEHIVSQLNCQGVGQIILYERCALWFLCCNLGDLKSPLFPHTHHHK